MKTTLVITDVTRMSRNYVCVAGLNTQGRSIRPILRDKQLTEEWLYNGNQVIIYPFSWVSFDLLFARPDPPHSEDWVIDPSFKKQVDSTNEKERRELLEAWSDHDVANIFGAEIQHAHGYFIREGEGNRSLGTIKANVSRFFHGMSFGSWDYRITFMDQANQTYILKVTDLSFRYYCDHLREKGNLSPEEISRQLSTQLISDTTFLRIGLARPTWDKYPHCCHLQITGVYSFPDYLDGRCFADFRP